MLIRKINGLTKAEFVNKCILKADEINPTWSLDIFKSVDIDPKSIWKSADETHGFSLSFVGEIFFNEALQLTPYYIETMILYNKDLVNLNKHMPWPYVVDIKKIGIYSSEVAVWAALCDNDLDALLKAYSRK